MDVQKREDQLLDYIADVRRRNDKATALLSSLAVKRPDLAVTLAEIQLDLRPPLPAVDDN